ncbi:MAG: amidohydrolase family protein [Pseudolysinimonas sp.]|uniref:amidohydrolase family protein n=1 Tax=Pseudolysinimonas sp. TaxID=2680009 RepID=UPI003263D865
MIIDAHLHVWDLARANYPWLGPGAGDLYRTIDIAEIEPTLQQRRIEGVVLVQASDEAGDTAVMRTAAAMHPMVLGIVAWSPLDDPERLAVALERFVADPLVVGIRNLVHEHPPAWLERPEVEEGFALLASHDFPFDFPTADPAALAALPGIGERHPKLTIVIDHLGKPPIGGTAAERDSWRALLAECARNPRTVAKLSGLYSARGALDSWTLEQVRPFADDAFELFGADRLLYGGDWPISELAGGYARTWDATCELLAGCDEAARDAVLGGNAARVYALDADRIAAVTA